MLYIALAKKELETFDLVRHYVSWNFMQMNYLLNVQLNQFFYIPGLHIGRKYVDLVHSSTMTQMVFFLLVETGKPHNKIH